MKPPSRWEHFFGTSLVKRITGYSAGSLVAATTGEAAFAVAYGWLHAGTTWASVAGFVGGAIPNYVLNRRWAWADRRGRDRRSEALLYAAVALSSFVSSAVGTHWAEEGARQLTSQRSEQVVLVAAAYLGVAGVFFVAKFVAYELVVFTRGPGRRAGGAGPPGAVPTTSSPPPLRNAARR